MRTQLTALLLCGVLTLTAAPAMAQSTTVLDLTPSAWEQWNWEHNTVPLANDAGGGLFLDFPVYSGPGYCPDCDTIDYSFTRNVPSNLEGAVLFLTLKVETLTGSPVFVPRPADDCSAPPNPKVRAFFWAHNNNFQDGFRWWSRDVAYEMESGTTTMTMSIPLDPGHWGNVKGELGSDTRRKWDQSIADVSSIGVTFGGYCNAGHGQYVTGGTARFTLQHYEVRFAPPCPTVAPCSVPCLSGQETGVPTPVAHACQFPDGSFMDCFNSMVSVVKISCTAPSCCTYPCICPTCKVLGTSLQCRVP